MARLGLLENRCLLAAIHNNGLLVRSTAYLVQSRCRSVTLLVYRGTDPFDLSTCAVSSDVNPVMVPVRDNGEQRVNGLLPLVGGAEHREDAPRVHGGFYRNQRATWFALTQALARAARGESVLTRQQLKAARPLVALDDEQALDDDWSRRVAAKEGDRPAIFITGHSLGGAMATIAAYKLASDPVYKDIVQAVAQVYTFAQPMVGDPGFKRAWDASPIAGRLFCHVHQRDVVPHLPPADTRQFVHVGKHYASIEREDEDPSTPEYRWGPLLEHPPLQARSWTDIVSSFFEFLGGQLPALDRVLAVASTIRNTAERGSDAVQNVVSRLPLIGRWVPDAPRPRARYSFYDHIPVHYATCSQPNGVLTEFGDDF